MTLNLGLRWDVQTPGTDPLNRFTTYVPGQKSTVNPAAPVGQLFYGDPGIERGVIKTAWNHVSPRVGIVWDPAGDGRTSVRAAAGMFYGSISGNEWNTMTNFQPWSTRLTFTNTNPRTSATGVPLGASLSNPYNAYVGGAPFPYNGTFANGGGIFGVSQDFQWAHSYQTNVGIERQVGRSLSVSASYVGSFNRDLPFARDVNYPVLNADRDQCRREHPGAPAEPGVRRRAAHRLGPDLVVQRPAGHGRLAPVAPCQLPRLLHAEQDDDAACSCRTTPRRGSRRTTAISPKTTAARTPTSATSST